MSQTALGTFFRQSANRVQAVFIVDGIQRTFSATVLPRVQPFTSNTAKVHYNDEDDLTSTRSYSGRIGPEVFQLNLDNGVMMNGKLNVPGLTPASTITGSGSWEQN